jgi:hypothetical protein
MVTTNRLAGAVHIGESDLPGLLYGAVVSASVLATASAHSEQYEYVAIAAFAVVGVYWLAHVYVGLHTRRLEDPAAGIWHRVATSARHEVSVLKGGLPAVLVYLAGTLLGLGAGSAAAVAVYFSVALLVCVGYVAAHLAGRTGAAALVDASVAGLFGVAVVVLKTLLH